MLEREVKNCRSFRMSLNLNDHHFETSRCNYRSKYTNLIVTTNQKSRIYTQNLERKEHNNTTKAILKPQQKKLKEEGTEKNYKNKQNTSSKMAINTYL